METIIYHIDDKEYKMFNLCVLGLWVLVASSDLYDKIEEMIEDDRYQEVRWIDEKFGYALTEDVEETEDAIRKYMEENFSDAIEEELRSLKELRSLA